MKGRECQHKHIDSVTLTLRPIQAGRKKYPATRNFYYYSESENAECCNKITANQNKVWMSSFECSLALRNTLYMQLNNTPCICVTSVMFKSASFLWF